MSKWNLRSLTCFVTHSEFFDFIDDYGIVMCYDLICPSTNQIAVDAPDVYISLYLSLFTIEACPELVTHFRHGLDTFSFPYPYEPFDEDLRARNIRHPFEAQTFSEPILYHAGLACSWEEALSNPLIFFGDEDMSFKNFLKLLGNWKRISDKRMKNQAKTDKNEHETEKHGKAKVK
ncbi:hypothetical protein Tco_1499542 [Tanacetum coccineum]